MIIIVIEIPSFTSIYRKTKIGVHYYLIKCSVPNSFLIYPITDMILLSRNLYREYCDISECLHNSSYNGDKSKLFAMITCQNYNVIPFSSIKWQFTTFVYPFSKSAFMCILSPPVVIICLKNWANRWGWNIMWSKIRKRRHSVILLEGACVNYRRPALTGAIGRFVYIYIGLYIPFCKLPSGTVALRVPSIPLTIAVTHSRASHNRWTGS